MKKFVIYTRLSKKEKNRNQYGFESQLEDIKYYLDGVGDTYEILETYQEFISGASSQRVILDKALELCTDSDAILLVSKLDRLSRKVSVIANLMERRDVQFKVATLPQADNFQLHLFSALAEQERERICDRVRKGMKAAKAKGVLIGAASEKYQQNPSNINKKRNTQARFKAERYREPLQAILASLPRPTYRGVANALSRACVELPSGIVGEWRGSQVQRIANRLEITIY